MTKTADFDTDRPLYTRPKANQTFNLIPRSGETAPKSLPIRFARRSTAIMQSEWGYLKSLAESSAAGISRKLIEESPLYQAKKLLHDPFQDLRTTVTRCL